MRSGRMRLIDADEILKKCNGGNCWYIPRDAIEDAPTIDAEPVVHCKECKQYHIAWGGRGFCMGDKSISGIVNDNDYCSYGERREP